MEQRVVTLCVSGLFWLLTSVMGYLVSCGGQVSLDRAVQVAVVSR